MCPGGGPIWCWVPCGDTDAREGAPGDRHGCSWRPSARGEVAATAGGPDHGAARLLGVSSGSSLQRRQPPSPAKQPSGPGGCRGLKSTSSRSFPHAAPRHRGVGGAALPTHACAPTAARSLRSQKSKFKNQKDAGIGERGRRRCADSGSLLAAARGGGRWRRERARGERGQVRQSVRRSPERAGRTCIRRTRRPCGLGHDSAAGPSSQVGAPGLRVGGWWALRTQETRNSGSRGEGSDGRSREEPRRCTAAEGGWSPQQSPRILLR